MKRRVDVRDLLSFAVAFVVFASCAFGMWILVTWYPHMAFVLAAMGLTIYAGVFLVLILGVLCS